MTLVKYEDYYPDYRDVFEHNDIKGLDVYAVGDDKVGSVSGALVDEKEGRFRYLIIDTGFWIVGKKVLLPIGMANIDFSKKRVDVKDLTKNQVENLPEFGDDLKIDQSYENRVRGIYRPGTATAAAPAGLTSDATYDRTTYDYSHDPALYKINDQKNPSFKLYEERLVARRIR